MSVENLSIARREEQVIQEYGTVVLQSDDGFKVKSESGVWQTRAAASCLLEPEVGDTVLLSAHCRHQAYILAVLERGKKAPVTLAFEDGATFKSRNGKLNLVGGSGINLVTEQSLDMISRDLRVDTRNAVVNMEEASFWGRMLESQIEHVKMFANTVDSILTRFFQKIRRSYRTIEESEHVKADRYLCDASTLISMKGKYSTLTAREDMKIDGERIHIG